MDALRNRRSSDPTVTPSAVGPRRRDRHPHASTGGAAPELRRAPRCTPTHHAADGLTSSGRPRRTQSRDGAAPAEISGRPSPADPTGSRTLTMGRPDSHL